MNDGHPAGAPGAMRGERGHGDAQSFSKIELELEREKIALERERLANERERLAIERLKLGSETEILRRRKWLLSPFAAGGIAVMFVLVGMVVSQMMWHRRASLAMDGAHGEKIIVRSMEDGSEREATAYLLFVK